MMKESSSSVNDHSIITVKLVGIIRHYVGKEEIIVSMLEPINLLSFIRELELKHGVPKHLLLDDKFDRIRSNLLVLVNGKEIGVLSGEKTILKNGDLIILLPVSHGG